MKPYSTDSQQDCQRHGYSQADLEHLLHDISLHVTLLENTHDAVIAVDQNFRVIYWNTSAEELYGWNAQDCQGKVLRDVVHDNMSEAQTVELLDAMQTHGLYKNEMAHYHREGNLLYVAATWVALKEQDQPLRGMLLAIRDLTEQKSLLEELTVEKERAQHNTAEISTALDAIPDAIILYDQNGWAAHANASAIRTLGFDPSHQNPIPIMQKMTLRWPNGEVVPPANLPLYRALRGEEIIAEEYIFTSPLEQENFVQVSAAPVYIGDQQTGVIVIWRNITEQINTEHALRDSEIRFHDLADAMPQLVWTATSEGNLDYYNQRYREYALTAPSNGEPWNWIVMLHPDDVQSTMDAWQAGQRTGSMMQIEHRMLMANGGYRWHLSRAVPVKDSQGSVQKWYGTSTDIHEYKQAQSALQAYTERLMRSNQELEQFAFVASHDLQEPVRKIRRFGDVLMRRIGDQLEAEPLDFLQRMQNSAERMEAMIIDLLELSRINTRGGNFEALSLSRLANEVVSDLEVRIAGTGGRVQIIEPLPEIIADSLQIRRLLLNLIGNALKFQRPGIPPEVTVSASTSPGSAGTPFNVILSVADNGIGFREDQLDRVFAPFQRLHGRSEYEGTGMGLAICKKIVERHHGQITAHSVPGQGTTFIITLPVKQDM